MEKTNRFNLPVPLVKALTGNHKLPIKGRYSVTSLIDSPLRRCLSMSHGAEIETDVSENLWMLLGTAVHFVIEQSGSGDQEVKIEKDYNGSTIVGVVDHYDPETKTITDWKITSVYSVLKGVKREWETQLNCYTYLLDVPVEKVQIYAILRDWSRAAYRKEVNNLFQSKENAYPPIPFVNISVPLWDKEKVNQYIKERVELHKLAEETELKNIPQCTEEERWTRPPKFAVAKKAQDRATRLLDTKEDAELYIAEKKLVSYQIFDRPGQDIRCLDYCGVSKFCPYKKIVDSM
jgi:hypothetical protein